MNCKELESFITEKLNGMKDEKGYIPILDLFGISGYMCEPERITRLIFPIIEEAMING